MNPRYETTPLALRDNTQGLLPREHLFADFELAEDSTSDPAQGTILWTSA